MCSRRKSRTPDVELAAGGQISVSSRHSSPAQHHTNRYSTEQYSTVQYSTEQHNIPFPQVWYSQDWHPPDHISFIDNIHLRPLHHADPAVVTRPSCV